jgi:hypothetical protein
LSHRGIRNRQDGEGQYEKEHFHSYFPIITYRNNPARSFSSPPPSEQTSRAEASGF